MAKNRPIGNGANMTHTTLPTPVVNPTPAQEIGIMDKIFEEDIRKNFTPEMTDALLGERDGTVVLPGGSELYLTKGEYKELIAKEEKLSNSERNRLERAYMHWRYLVDEIGALANDGVLVGPMRQAAAKVGAIINDSNAALWAPLKTVGAVLDMVRDQCKTG